MAINSLGNLSNKSSTNHKADLIAARLNELKIAYEVMSRHPVVLNEYVCAVKGGANHLAESPTAVTVKKQFERGPPA